MPQRAHAAHCLVFFFSALGVIALDLELYLPIPLCMRVFMFRLEAEGPCDERAVGICLWYVPKAHVMT